MVVRLTRASKLSCGEVKNKINFNKWQNKIRQKALKDFTIIIVFVYIKNITARLVTNLPDKHLCFRTTLTLSVVAKLTGALKDRTVSTKGNFQ